MSASLHRLALQELLDATDFYQSRSPELADEFLSAIEEALDLLDRHPKAAPLVGENSRRLVLARFPYNIVYSLLAGEIRVLAIAHHSRSPNYWLGRT